MKTRRAGDLTTNTHTHHVRYPPARYSVFSMTASSGRVAWVGLWIALAAGAGIALVLFFGPKPKPPAATLLTAAPATFPTTQPLPPHPPKVIQTYGQLLHADLTNYP